MPRKKVPSYEREPMPDKRLNDPLFVFRLMGREERKRTLSVQRWVLSRMETDLEREKGKRETRIKKLRRRNFLRLKYKTSRDLLEAYMSGEIKPEEYKHHHRMLMSANEPDEWMYGDRVAWLEIQVREQKGLIAELERIQEELPPEKTYRKHGYDPRKNISKFNVLPDRFDATYKEIQENKKKEIDKDE